MATLIDGKAVAAELRSRIKAEVDQLNTAGRRIPCLAVILVGEDPASQVYVRNKGEQTREVGMLSIEHKYDTSITQNDLLHRVQQLNDDPTVDGILVQLPLPSHIQAETVLQTIDPKKDVDGFHPLNVGALNAGFPALVPCTPSGCMHLLRKVHPSLSGLHAVVIGRSNIVGKPVAQLLLQADCTVTIAHSRTKNLEQLCQQADVVIAAVGRPNMVKGSWLKAGATVIDVGINRVMKDNGKTGLVGDVDFASAQGVAGAITPVPGGVGPMTIACLLQNTLQSYTTRENITP